MTVLSPPPDRSGPAWLPTRRPTIIAQASHYTDAIRAVIAIGGIGLGAGSLAGLFISETSGLFGFVEHGYRMAIVVAIAVEVAAIVFLLVYLLANGTGFEKIGRSSR